MNATGQEGYLFQMTVNTNAVVTILVKCMLSGRLRAVIETLKTVGLLPGGGQRKSSEASIDHRVWSRR